MKFNEIDKRTGPQSAKTSFGTVMHFVLQDYNITENVDQAIKLWTHYWHHPEELNTVPDFYYKGTSHRSYHIKGIEILKRYDEKQDWGKRVVLATEHPFLVPFGKHELTGFVDVVELRKVRGDWAPVVVDYKPLHVDTLVLTPTGWKKIRDIQVGGRVIGLDGYPVKVVGAKDQGALPAYRVGFSDGSSTVCSEDHLWAVQDVSSRQNRVLPLKDLKSLLIGSGTNNRYFTPTAAPVKFDDSGELPIPPYVMGVLLSEGCLDGSVNFSTIDTEIVDRVRDELPVCKPDAPVRRRTLPGGRRVYLSRMAANLHVTGGPKDWRISRTPGSPRRHPYIEALRSYGLWGLRAWEKFIPEHYLRSGVAERIALLAGLMDGDGGSSTRTNYHTSSVLLRDDVVELCRSLGGVPTTSTHNGYYTKANGQRVNCRDHHIVTPRLPFNPFFLKRKASTWKPPVERQNRAIVSITPEGVAEMRCIKVDNEDGLFVTEGYVVTHNTSSRQPTALQLRSSIQFTLYYLASQQQEFWLGNGPDFPAMEDGEKLWESYGGTPSILIWSALWHGKEFNAGDRNERDFMRLYRVIDMIQRAIDLDVYVPNVSHESCGNCPYTEPCGLPYEEDVEALGLV